MSNNAADIGVYRPETVCVVDGWGVSIRVHRGALVVQDGTGEDRRERTYHRATHGLSRIVLTHPYGGAISIDALTWARRLGIGVLVLGPDGAPTLASAPRTTDDARLRRQQALAPEQPVGLRIARYLLSVKVAGQGELTGKRLGCVDTADTIAELAQDIEAADTIDRCRQLEAAAASLYWDSWVEHPATSPRFAPGAAVPPHWRCYTGRRSVLAAASGNKKASHPTNALVNYLFGCLEAEAILACHAVGLDPGLGITHQDTRARQSLALDLMEPVRPQVEELVIAMLAGRTWPKGAFLEGPDGWCRLSPPVRAELASYVPSLAQWVAPFAERVAHMLGDAMAGRYVPVTPLTRSRGKAAQAIVKARKTPKQRPGTTRPTPLYTCTACGAPVDNARHTRCQGCQDADPRQIPAIRATRALAISRARRRDAEQASVGDLSWEAIRPRLASVGLTAIMRTCGVSKSTAWSWKTGRTTPAPCHLAPLSVLSVPAAP